jgi:hypothetical protein
MSPNFGMGRPNMPMNPINPRRDTTPQQGTSLSAPQALAAPSPIIHYSFNVPFTSDLAGPDTEDILHATADAVMRWTHPEDAADNVQVYELPVHAQNLANLRKVCKDITSGPFQVEAHVLSATPKSAKGQQVTTVCLSGTPEMVHKSRETILNDNSTSLVGSIGEIKWVS